MYVCLFFVIRFVVVVDVVCLCLLVFDCCLMLRYVGHVTNDVLLSYGLASNSRQ